MPPLPPGPPPPPPSTVPNPYAQPYAYSGYQATAPPPVAGAQQAAAHPQYPGYGYGGPPPPVPTPAPYPNYAPQYGQPPIPPPFPGAPYPQPPQPYPQPQGYAAYPQPPQYPPPVQGYPGYPPQGGPPPPPPPPPQNSYPPGPPPVQQQHQQQQQQQQAYPNYNVNPPLPSGQPSPGAPPFKRTRYDSTGPPQTPTGPQGGMQPPPALPPLNAYNNQGGGRGGGNSGRGGYSGINNNNRGGMGGNRDNNINGGGYNDQMGGRNYASSSQSFGNASPASSSGGMSNGNRGGMNGGGGGNYRNGARGDSRNGPGGSYDSRNDSRNVSAGSSSYNRGGSNSSTPHYPRAGAGVGSSSSIAFAPSGPSSQTRGRGGNMRDGSGRPVVGLYGRGNSSGRSDGGSTSRASPGPELPKGPRAGVIGGRGGSSLGLSSANARTPNKDRKWGNSSGGGASGAKEEAKKTLTDFRISKLAITEIEWEWKAEAIKAVAAIVKEIDSSAEVKQEEETEPQKPESISTPTAKVFDVPTSPLSSVTQQPISPPAKYDMSVDSIIPLSDEVNPDLSEEESKVGLEAEVVETELDSAPQKKLTKKQKQAAATAAKRLATIASKAQATATLLDEGETTGIEVKVEVPETSSVVKKDAKHGRDEDEEEDSLVITDVTAKKVKADTGELVVLEKVEVAKEVQTESLLPVILETAGSHHSRVIDVDSPELFVPTGPSADTNRTPTLAYRENSRLRIYFSSPVAPLPLPIIKRSEEIVESLTEEDVPESQGEVEQVAEAEAKAEEEEEELKVHVGEDDEDVDGEPMPASDVKEEVREDTLLQEDVEESEDDEDSVQSSLLLPRAEVVSVSEEPEHESTSMDASIILPSKAPVDGLSSSAISEPQQLKSQLEPAADRISISYAKNTRRLVIDASAVDHVRIFRGDGRIEIVVLLEDASTKVGEVSFADEHRVCKGILIESLDVEADDYVVIDRSALELAWATETETVDLSESTLDHLLPPLHHLLDAQAQAAAKNDDLEIISGKNQFTIVVTIDKVNPLTEARWVKTGEVDAWMHTLALDSKSATSQWKGKITVSDPDPPPTIQHALDTWAAVGGSSGLASRTAFVQGHMSNFDNVFEILLRLTRGERPTPSHYTAPPQPSSVGALAATLSAPYADSQTQVSLAVLSMFRLSMDSATKAGIPKEEIEKQVGDVIRGIPYHLIFKSLDTMFKEYRNAQ